MGREKALAFIGICTLAVVFNLKNLSVLVSRGSVAQPPREPALALEVCVCVLSLVPVRWVKLYGLAPISKFVNSSSDLH